MTYQNLISKLPGDLQSKITSLPVFDVDQSSNGASTAIVTKEEMAEFIVKMEANTAWLIPVRPESMEDEDAALCIRKIMHEALTSELFIYDQFHVPDIDNEHSMLPCIMIFDPTQQQLAKLAVIAGINFLVEVKLSADKKEADTKVIKIEPEMMINLMSLN